MKKTCLNCKYEPNWGVYKIIGYCGWFANKKIPSLFSEHDMYIKKDKIIEYCRAWEAK